MVLFSPPPPRLIAYTQTPCLIRPTKFTTAWTPIGVFSNVAGATPPRPQAGLFIHDNALAVSFLLRDSAALRACTTPYTLAPWEIDRGAPILSLRATVWRLMPARRHIQPMSALINSASRWMLPGATPATIHRCAPNGVTRYAKRVKYCLSRGRSLTWMITRIGHDEISPEPTIPDYLILSVPCGDGDGSEDFVGWGTGYRGWSVPFGQYQLFRESLCIILSGVFMRLEFSYIYYAITKLNSCSE